MKRFSRSSILLLCLCASVAAQGEQDLRITTKKGASVWLTQETKMEQAIDMGGQQMDMGNATTYTLQVTVKEVDDKGQLVVEAKIARVLGTMTMPMMGDIEFDSIDQKPGDAKEGEEADGMGMPDFDSIGRAMGSLAGNTFIAKVDPFGKVTSIDGIEKALEAARKKAGRMGAQMLGAQLNESAMQRMVESAFGTLPGKPIAVGGTWERSEDQKSSRMQVANKMKLTLTKADAEFFEIAATGTIEKPATEAAGEAKADESDEAKAAREMLSKMKIENGKIAGTAKISRTDGFMVASTSNMSMDMTMPSPMGGGDMTINQKVTTTTKRTTEEAAMKKAGAAKAPETAKEPAKQAGK